MWTWSSEFELRKCEFEFAYLIVVIFGMESKFKVVGDFLNSFMVVWLWIWHEHKLEFHNHASVGLIFLIKYVYLDWLRWNFNVGYVMSLKKAVMWILPKWVEYERFHKWLKEVIWINDVSKWVYGSILCDWMRKNIKLEQGGSRGNF